MDNSHEEVVEKVTKVLPVQQKNDYSAEGLTFKQIFKFIGNAMPRIALYSVISLLIAIIICFSVYFATKKTDTQAFIEFSYLGIEKGQDPLGEDFNSESIIAPNVLQKAINAQGLNLDLAILSESIVITPIIPTDIAKSIENAKKLAESDSTKLGELDTLQYYPRRFMLTIKDNKELGLDANAVELLLNEILKQYELNYKEKYGQIELLGTISNIVDFQNIDSVDYYYDYYEVVDLMTTELDNAINYFEKMSDKTQGYRSNTTGMSFSDIEKELITIRNINISKLSGYVITNAITINKTNTIDNLTLAISLLNIDKTQKENEITSKKEIIDDYKKGAAIIPNGDNYIIETTDSATYDKMVQELSILKTEKEEIQAKIAIYQARLDILIASGESVSTEEQLLTANQLVKDVSGIIENSVEVGETLVEEYRNTKLLNDSIYILDASSNNTSDITFTKGLVICILFILVGAIVAMFVYDFKSKRQKIN